MVHRTPELIAIGQRVGVDPEILGDLESSIRLAFEAASRCDAPRAFQFLSAARLRTAAIERRAEEMRDLVSRSRAASLMDATDTDLQGFWRRSCSCARRP